MLHQVKKKNKTAVLRTSHKLQRPLDPHKALQTLFRVKTAMTSGFDRFPHLAFPHLDLPEYKLLDLAVR